MRNKNLFENKMDRLSGKLQLLKVQITRNTSLAEIRRTIEESEELVDDMRDIVERG